MTSVGIRRSVSDRYQKWGVKRSIRKSARRDDRFSLGAETVNASAANVNAFIASLNEDQVEVARGRFSQACDH